MEEQKVFLKYVGNGSYLPDVPARDLTKDEAEYNGVGRLLDSHLYERVSIVGEAFEIGKVHVLSDELTKELVEKFNNEPKNKRGKQ